MNKKIIVVLLMISIAFTLLIFLQYYFSKEIQPEYVEKNFLTPDIIMPSKVSRPGCEKTDSCYIPSQISINSGQQVIWQNQDSAFHSVTSGVYGEPTILFDSGHLDPDQIFTYTFEEPGHFDYFCTLHPWMEGIVFVN